jgi:RNA polymerase sigma factor (sigma-70 family)
MPSPKVVPLRSAAGLESPSDLSQLALRGAESGAQLAELAERLSREPQLRALAAKLSGSLAGHSADDLMQCTLERVVRGIASYRGTGDVLGWVSRIMRNTQIELARREVRERGKQGSYALEGHRPESLDPADLLSNRELRRVVLEAWRRTSEDPEVRMFWQRVYVGLSVDQIVRQSGHPRSTVYVMLKRGCSKLLCEFERLMR